MSWATFKPKSREIVSEAIFRCKGCEIKISEEQAARGLCKECVKELREV